MTSRKVAVVTGGNKGIGFEIVKGLCKKFDGDVYLTDIERGQEGVEKLKALGLTALFHQIDIRDQKSVDKFRDHLKSKHGGIDLLVNNAGIMIRENSKDPYSVIARQTIDTNYYGTLKVCNALFPLLRQDGRVVQISSSAGHLSQIVADDLRAEFNDKNITIDELNKIMERYVRDVSDGKGDKWIIDDSFGHGAYVISKVGVSCLTQIQQKLFDAEKPYRNISVNSVHPGFLATDLAADYMVKLPGVARPVEEGARAPLFLALEANLKGKYVWSDCTLIDWEAPSCEPY